MFRFRPPRHASRLQIRVARGYLEDRFTVLDVSETGMKLAGLLSLPPGAEVTLHVQSIDLAARVVWAREERAGVRFLTPISPRTLASIRRVAGAERSRWSIRRAARSRTSTWNAGS